MLEERYSGDAAIRPRVNSQSRGTSAAREKRVIFVNKYFYPDHSATSQILSDLAFHLAGSGYIVRVLTSTQRYDDPRADLPEAETRGGVLITRLATTRFGRSTLVGRGVDYLSFYRAAWRSVITAAKPGDIVVAKTDPPMLSAVISHAAKRRNVSLVNWLQDLYPEIAIQLRVPFIKGPVAQWLMQLRDVGLRLAEANVVVGEGMAEVLHSRGVESNRIHVIPNWCDDEEIRPIPHHDNPLRREWSLEDRFVIGYSGNLGKGHEFDTILAAAESLRSATQMLFLFIGGGSKFDELARRVHERKLDGLFRFISYQERGALKYSLAVPDVHWLSLTPALERLVVPSKFYGIAAAGRPIIAITAQDGELARLVLRYRCGKVVEPGGGLHLAAVLRGFYADQRSLKEMGLRARAMLDDYFTRQKAFALWHNLLDGLT